MIKQKFIIIITLLMMLWGCQTGEENGGSEVLNPEIRSISPDSRALYLPWFTLTIEGENFREGAKIFFNEVRKTTERVSDSRLRCTVNPMDLIRNVPGSVQEISGTRDNVVETVPVYVVNYASGGRESGRSNTVNFAVLEHPRFNDAVNISRTSGWAEFPMIASGSNGILHVIWVDNSQGQGAVFYRRSSDRGDTWDETRKISPDGIVVCCPELAVGDDGNVYVAFGGGGGAYDTQGIFFLRSDDYGLNWNWFSMLSTPGLGAYIPDIAVNNYGEVAVVWFEFIRERRSDIFFTRSGNYGASWSTPENISDNIGHSDSATVAVDGEGNIYVAWKDNRPGDWDVFFRRGLNYGTQWDDTMNLSNDAVASVRPVMACDIYGQVFISWFDLGALERGIYYTRSWELGIQWAGIELVTHSSALSSDPAIAMDEFSNANIVWTNYGQGSDPDEIMFSRGIYGSGPWSPAAALTGKGALFPNYPDIAIDYNGNIYIVWQQWQEGSHSQIMFTHSR